MANVIPFQIWAVHNRPDHNRPRPWQTTFTTDHVHDRPVHNKARSQQISS